MARITDEQTTMAMLPDLDASTLFGAFNRRESMESLLASLTPSRDEASTVSLFDPDVLSTVLEGDDASEESIVSSASESTASTALSSLVRADGQEAETETDMEAEALAAMMEEKSSKVRQQDDSDDLSSYALLIGSISQTQGQECGGSFVLSNINRFTVRIMFRHRATKELCNHKLRIKATLRYENHELVKEAGADDVLLDGQTATTLFWGSAAFKLQLGANALSSKHNHRFFRLRVEPEDDAVAAAYPDLTQTTAPFKAVTKLGKLRKTARPLAPAAPRPPSASPSGRAPMAGETAPADAAVSKQEDAAGEQRTRNLSSSKENFAATGIGEGSGQMQDELQKLEQSFEAQRTEQACRYAQLMSCLAAQRQQMAELQQKNMSLLEQLARMREVGLTTA